MMLIKSITLIIALVVNFSLALPDGLRTRELTYPCSSDYICPKNSCRIPGLTCYESFDDCKCNEGYEKSPKKDKCIPIKPKPTRPPTHPPTAPPTCSNDYVCPKHSCRIPGLPCYDSFEDCKCDEGYEKSPSKDKCIPIKPKPTRPPTHPPTSPPVCLNDYICPKNSCRIEGRKCYDNFEDCKCNAGYEKSAYEDKCIPIKPKPTRPPKHPPTPPPVCLNDYICPKNSCRIEGHTCYDSFEDCKCNAGYEKSAYEDKCIPIKPICLNDYICPKNSYRIDGRKCYDNFDDCKCNYGYYKSTEEDKCLKHPWCKW